MPYLNIYVYIIFNTNIYKYIILFDIDVHLPLDNEMLPLPYAAVPRPPKVYILYAYALLGVPFMSFSWYPWHFSSLPSRWQASQVCHGVRDAPGQHGSNQQRDDADYEENDRGRDARLLCRMIPWLMLTEFRLPKCLPFC